MNLIPNPSESKGENGCDVPACFTTFSNILFDADYEFNSSDDQSLYDEDVPEKIFSNPLFEEEIIPMKIDPHHFNAESDRIESLLNHDSSIIPSSSKIDSLLDEFFGELTLLKSIPPGIDETDCDPENEIRLTKILLYDNSSPHPPEEFDLPDHGELMSVLNSEIRENLLSTTLVNLPIEDDHSPLLAYVVWIFVSYLTYLVIPPYLHPFGNEDTIFDPGITINHFYSCEPVLSHRHGAFRKFNTHRSHLNEWPMIINGKNTPFLDVLLFHFYPP
nr:hypothetical protein [Tanacetum cinerariifolium]